MVRKKKVFFKTYGCQMNVYDSERMTESLISKGYRVTNTAESADVILLNTCHIREKAAEKVYSELGRYKILKSNNPNLQIGVAGCVAQAEGEEIIRRQPLVDVVVGPQTYHRLPEMLERARKGNKVVNTEFPRDDKFEYLKKISRQKKGPTAFLTIQEGCDKFCSFCVVPYTRGNESSRPAERLLREAEELVDLGVIEITLLGQNVNAYKNGDWSLTKLIKKLAKISELKRIRFTTSHPNDMSSDLVKAFGDEEKLMPFLHLPVQSGSDKVLKLMNRRHTSAEYLEIFRSIRRVRPDIALSGDFIVGFPGETEEDFYRTLKLCEEVEYAQAYSFKFSARPGTPAAKRKQVDEEIKSWRLHELQNLLSDCQAKFQSKMIGKSYPVLLEKKGRQVGQVVGRSPYLQPVFLDASSTLIGNIVDVKIKHSNRVSLQGIIA